MVYLWRVVMPLHRPMKYVVLDYSNRLSHGEKVFINRQAYAESAERVRSIIVEHIPFLQALQSPAEFLQHISWMRGNPSIPFRADLALTYFRLGELQQARELLRAVNRELDEPYRLQQEVGHPELKQKFDELRQMARCIEEDPDQLAALIDTWEKQNIETFGLGPSLISH
jgi:hypothetical protein